MDEMAEVDVMDRQWCCLACNTRFRFGKIRMLGCDTEHPHGLGCPTCGSGALHPADGTEHVLTDYHGETGTLQ